jgi:16S rRNA (uracil1498-N3)-methyltransferase
MPSERYYLDQDFERESSCELTGQEFHHLAHVMRGSVGDIVELVNGRGALAHASIDRLSKTAGTLRIKQVFEEKHRPRIILAQALPKPNRLDFVLEKGTELGVDDFWLFPGSRSQKKELYPNQVERARQLTISALKQSGRLTLPALTFKPPLNNWEGFENCSSFFGDLDPDAPPLIEALQNSELKLPVLFFVGPESGFDDDELNKIRALGAKGVKLHNNILRTETASLTAISLISYWLCLPGKLVS